jgi:ribosomal protein S18 acetylase RimI-like enzyme
MGDLAELDIRVGTTDRCAEVLELWGRAGAAVTVTDNIPALLRLIETDEQALLVAETGGQVIGTVIAAWNGWRGSLYRLAVDPDHRRAGVATRLVHDAERRLRQRGAIRIDAIVSDDDGAARRFWTAAGYQHHHGRSRFVRDL